MFGRKPVRRPAVPPSHHQHANTRFILTHIFILCLPSAPTDCYVVDNPRPLLPSEAPLLVSSICRRWREVSLNTPRLWCSLDLNNGRGADGVVSSWISRSLPYPLSFTTTRTYRAQVVKELNRHSERWGAVELLIPRQGHYLFDEVRGRLPCLTKLCLNLKSESELVIESFAEAPRLEQLYLISGLYSVTFVLPWHQLTTLTCENFTNVECMQILQLCEALVDCSLIGKPTRISMGLNLSAPITRQHLTSLRAEGMATQRILQILELPSLRDLQWEVDFFGDSLEILLSFLARSHCRLRNICLWLIKGKDLIQRFTPFFTSLVVLEIRTFEEFLNDEFLRWFTRDLEALPNLRKIAMDLDLQDWRAQNWTVELMREMIQSRCPGFTASRSVCLDTFRLVYRPDKDEDDTGLLHLAAEFKPLLDPKMIEFTISPNSKNWNLDLDSDSDFSSDFYWSD